MKTRLPFLALAAFAVLALSAPAAHAFTFENKADASNNGSTNLSDPEDRLTSRYSTGNRTVIQRGNTTFTFGGSAQPSDMQYNTERMFNPNGRPGDNYGR